MKNKCLYFDDEIDEDYAPLKAFLKLVKDSYLLDIEEVSEFNSIDRKLHLGGFDLLFLDIRISEEKGGGIDDNPWQRTGLSLLKRIRSGFYEPNTLRDIPIIIITAVADAIAQNEIISIGKGENSQYRFTLFEKPAYDDEVGETAMSFLND
jgi:CheY-like chemotaxis protein